MVLKVNVRKASEVPRATAAGKVNEDLEALKQKMASLPAGMVLEVEVDKKSSVRATKALITRAAKVLGTTAWKHWHLGNRVYAQPAGRRRRRRRRS